MSCSAYLAVWICGVVVTSSVFYNNNIIVSTFVKCRNVVTSEVHSFLLVYRSQVTPRLLTKRPDLCQMVHIIPRTYSETGSNQVMSRSFVGRVNTLLQHATPAVFRPTRGTQPV